MTKEELRSHIKNLIKKIDKSSDFHPFVLDATIERVLNSMITDLFLKGGQMEPFFKRYGDDTAVAVVSDLTTTTISDYATGISYSTIPVAYIPLPDKASGIRHIYTVEMSGITFYPMDAREADLVYRNTYFSKVSNKIGYVVMRDKIEYYGMTVAVAADGVRMDIVLPFRQYADTDVVNIPGNASDELIKGVLEILGVIQPIDLKDNNTNKEEK